MQHFYWTRADADTQDNISLLCDPTVELTTAAFVMSLDEALNFLDAK